MDKHKHIIKLTFGGDVMCLRAETEAVMGRHGRLDYSEYIGELAPLFIESDYVVANLETPISKSASLTTRDIQFNTDEALLRALRQTGFSFLATGNNHCLDAGVEGIAETIDALDRNGFDHDGTYNKKEDSEKIFVKQIGGVRFAMLSFTYGTNSEHNGILLPTGEEWRVALLKKQNKLRKMPQTQGMNDGNFRTYIADDVLPAAIANPVNQYFLQRAAAKVERAKANADFVIVLPHVGGQFNPGPATYAKYVVATLTDAGADMVVAGHPHVSQRCGRWRGEGNPFVAYSLGNLCFTPGVGFFVQNVLSEYGIVLHVYIEAQSRRMIKMTFDTVKSIVDDDGYTRVIPVIKLLETERNAAKRDRLLMENEAVVNRFRGTAETVLMDREYSFPDVR